MSDEFFNTSWLSAFSSAILSMIFPEDSKIPSCTWRNEIAFPTFASTPLSRLIEPLSFIATASPPASSAGLVIRLPLERRFKLFCRALLFLVSWKLARAAAMLVLIVIDIVLVLLDLVVYEKPPVFRIAN